MLNLVKCEFLKLKRKKIIPIGVLFSIVIPIIFSFIINKQFHLGVYINKIESFDSLFDMTIVYGMQFLLQFILGILSTIIFFEERDNDTFKNLKVIPITSTKLILSKIFLIFIISIVFCIFSTLAVITFGGILFDINDIWYKFIMSIDMGIFIALSVLPIIAITVYFSKTYIFSILLCIFWVSLNTLSTALYDVLPKFILWLMPTPLTLFWASSKLYSRGLNLNLDLPRKLNLIPNDIEIITILGIVGIISIILIDYIYRKRSDS